MLALQRRKSWVAAALLIVALGLRVGQIELSSYRPINDARLYLTLARSVARTGDYPSGTGAGGGSGGSRGPSALFPPAFPYLLGLIDRVDGRTSAIGPAAPPARYAQAVLGTVSVALVGLIALEAFGWEVGLVALTLAAIDPDMVATSGTLLAENLLVTLELAAVLCGLRIRRARHPYRYVVLAGIFTGLAALTHENGVVLLPPLAACAWSSLSAARSRRAALTAPLLLIIVAALTIAPWTVRNAVELHAFVPISDQAGETLLGTYNPASAHSRTLPYKWLPPYRISSASKLVREAPRLREPVWEDRLLTRAFRYIRTHPLSPLAATFHNGLRLLDLDGSLAWKISWASIGLSEGEAEVGVLGFWLLALLAALGALSRRVRSGPRWIWAVPVLYVLSTVWVRVETPRFRLPADPFLAVLAACAIVTLATRGRLAAGVPRVSRRPSQAAPA